jgi:DNA-binding response OmpR family regulator
MPNSTEYRGGLKSNMRILLIEDEAKIADFVRSGLSARGMAVSHCDNGDEGLKQAQIGDYDVLVLDIMLPGANGLTILKTLRRSGITTPVLLLTARNELNDRVKGFELGADDYLPKPFYVEELAARLQALLRRDRSNSLQVGSFKLDRLTRQASCNGRNIDLTTREFSLLEYLMRSAGEVFTRTQILEHVWGYDFDPSTNVVDVCVRRIRGKIAELEPDPQVGSPIEAVRGSGYRFRLHA